MDDRNSSDTPIIGGSRGNTSGTGGPELSGTGAAGIDGRREEGETRTRARDDDEARPGLSGGDESVEAAIGGEGRPAGTMGSPTLSGRSSSEGNERLAIAPDPGDPGGMGGVRAAARNAHGRPPGGVSPIDPQESSEG